MHACHAALVTIEVTWARRAYGTLLVWRVTAKGTNWTSLFACDCTRKIRHWSPLFTPAYSYSHLLQLIQLIDIMRYVGTTIYYTFLYQGATFFLECYMFSVLYTKYIWHFNIIFSSVCTYVMAYIYIYSFFHCIYSPKNIIFNYLVTINNCLVSQSDCVIC